MTAGDGTSAVWIGEAFPSGAPGSVEAVQLPKAGSEVFEQTGRRGDGRGAGEGTEGGGEQPDQEQRRHDDSSVTSVAVREARRPVRRTMRSPS